MVGIADDGTGKYVWDSWTNKIAHREQMICLLPAGVRGDDIKRHPAYIERGAYYLDQVGFDPTEKDRAVKLNTWRGWPMEPRQGCCERILEPVARVLCTWIFPWTFREPK
jgi:putative DNA primase/helicase